MQTDIQAVKSRMRFLHLGIMIGFVLVALAMIYWSVIQGPEVLQRNDNPRLIEAELRLKRGRILDVNNQVLAETVGPLDDLRRIYLTDSSGPAVGYYSIRHGTAGIEAGFDNILRGETGEYWDNFWSDKFLHQNREGQDVRLTIDARWQRAANSLLGDRRGAILLFSLPDMNVRAMARAVDDFGWY